MPTQLAQKGALCHFVTKFVALLCVTRCVTEYVLQKVFQDWHYMMYYTSLGNLTMITRLSQVCKSLYNMKRKCLDIQLP